MLGDTQANTWKAFTLGQYVFYFGNISEQGRRHETGHSIQSKYLGWLYLPLVGLPSVILYWYKTAFNKSAEWYHGKYPEHWADKLGGVI